MQHRQARRRMVVSADGSGVVSHAGARLLGDLAEHSTLTERLSTVLAGLRRPRTRHDPGQVLTDLATAIADGAECISDIATLAACARTSRKASGIIDLSQRYLDQMSPF